MFVKFVLTCIIVEASYPTETPHHERNLQQYQQPKPAQPNLLKELLGLIQGGLDSLNIGNDFIEEMNKLVKQMRDPAAINSGVNTLLEINDGACKLFCDTTADGCTMMPKSLAMNNLAVTCSGSASPVGIRFDDPEKALQNLDIAKLLTGEESFIHWTCPNSQSSDYGSEGECRPGWLNALIPSQYPACSTCSTASANVAPVSDRDSESTTTTTTTTNSYNQDLKEEEEVEDVSSTTTIVVIIVVVVVVILLIILTVCVLMSNSSKREGNMKKKPDLSKAQGPPAGKKSESKAYRGAGLE